MSQKKRLFARALHELKVIEARLQNRDTRTAESLRQQNSVLSEKVSSLEKELFLILAADGRVYDPRTERDRAEALREQALNFLKTLKVDPKIWQNLASS